MRRTLFLFVSEVPLPRHGRKVAGVLEQSREGDDVFRQVALMPRLSKMGGRYSDELGQLAEARKVVVGAGE